LSSSCPLDVHSSWQQATANLPRGNTACCPFNGTRSGPRSFPKTKPKKIPASLPKRNPHLQDEPFGSSAVYSHTEKWQPNKLTVILFVILKEDTSLCFCSKSKTKCFKITVKTQKQSKNISTLLWQHASVLLDHLQTSIQRYEVQSVHIMYCGI